MRWEVYYSDGSSIGSEDATPFSIFHRADIQVIIQADTEHGWVTVSGNDYYIWDDKGGGAKWWEVDIFGLHHYLLQPGSKCVLFGTVIDNDTFREIFDRARSEFGNKEAFATDERHP